jgi:hypothetical protein
MVYYAGPQGTQFVQDDPRFQLPSGTQQVTTNQNVATGGFEALLNQLRGALKLRVLSTQTGVFLVKRLGTVQGLDVLLMSLEKVIILRLLAPALVWLLLGQA